MTTGPEVKVISHRLFSEVKNCLAVLPVLRMCSCQKNKTNLGIWNGNLEMRQQIQYFDNSKKSIKDTAYDC
jgi:hypothetical protein